VGTPDPTQDSGTKLGANFGLQNLRKPQSYLCQDPKVRFRPKLWLNFEEYQNLGGPADTSSRGGHYQNLGRGHDRGLGAQPKVAGTMLEPGPLPRLWHGAGGRLEPC